MYDKVRNIYDKSLFEITGSDFKAWSWWSEGAVRSLVPPLQGKIPSIVLSYLLYDQGNRGKIHSQGFPDLIIGEMRYTKS